MFPASRTAQLGVDVLALMLGLEVLSEDFVGLRQNQTAFAAPIFMEQRAGTNCVIWN